MSGDRTGQPGSEPEPAAPAAPAAEPTPEPTPAPAPTPAGPPRDWRNDRIDQLTASGHSQRQRIAALTAELEEARRVAAAAQPPASAPTPAVAPGTPAFEDLVQRAAAERAAAQDFTRRCDEAATAGRTQFPDFDSRINNLRGLVDPHDQQSLQAYNNFLAAALETGRAHTVLHSLGGDLNEAARLLSLSPVRMAVELERLAAKQDPGSQTPSGAPRPITPVGSHSAAHTQIEPDDPDRADQLDTRAWMARRNKQAEVRGLR